VYIFIHKKYLVGAPTEYFLCVKIYMLPNRHVYVVVLYFITGAPVIKSSTIYVYVPVRIGTANER